MTGGVSLEAQVAQHVSAGWRVESQTPSQAVMVKGKRPNHLLHLILSVLTVGLWLIVWLIVALAAGEKRRVLHAPAEPAAVRADDDRQE